MRLAVVGAGFAGLAAAYDLAQQGHDVTVYESAAEPGGLAAGFRDARWDWPLEHFYHHLFTSDADIIGLAEEVGFADKLLTLRPITASFYEDQAYALDGPVAVLQFPGMPFLDRVRMGLVVAYLKVMRDWKRLENVTVSDWLGKWMGRRAVDAIWEPLMIGKFGRFYEQVPMSYLWARLHKRSMRLIYVHGGFQAFADHLQHVVEGLGVRVHLNTPVEEIGRSDDGNLFVRAPNGQEDFDRVVVTTAPYLLARVCPKLPPEYLDGLSQLKHLGAVVAVLALDRRLMDEVYWLSMDKREFPFLACVEHTNFVEREHYGGDHIVYVGDYVETDHRYLTMDDDDVLSEWYEAIGRINPDFDPSWVKQSWVFRSSYAQPVVSLGFSKNIPPLETPIPGLFLASMSQVYPWDRGTNFAVEIGRKAAAKAIGGS